MPTLRQRVADVIASMRIARKLSNLPLSKLAVELSETCWLRAESRHPAVEVVVQKRPVDDNGAELRGFGRRRAMVATQQQMGSGRPLEPTTLPIVLY